MKKSQDLKAKYPTFPIVVLILIKITRAADKKIVR